MLPPWLVQIHPAVLCQSKGWLFNFSFLFSSTFALSQSTALEVITLSLIFAENPSIWQGQYNCPFDFFSALWPSSTLSLRKAFFNKGVRILFREEYLSSLCWDFLCLKYGISCYYTSREGKKSPPEHNHKPRMTSWIPARPQIFCHTGQSTQSLSQLLTCKTLIIFPTFVDHFQAMKCSNTFP